MSQFCELILSTLPLIIDTLEPPGLGVAGVPKGYRRVNALPDIILIDLARTNNVGLRDPLYVGTVGG